jgi:endonuclease/exonuclease/phosphatase family metal-dependent hydrolase
VIHISEEIDFWRLPVAPAEEGVERRALLRAVVTLVGGFRVHLYNTHPASGSSGATDTDRNTQALAVVDRVNADWSGEGHRAVLLGDLNSKPGDPTLEPPIPPDPAITTLNGPLQDAWTALYPDPDNRPPGYTSTPTNPHQRIDYVFNDRSSPVPVEGTQVGTSIGLSDHHRLWADL